jgi:pilus assembly protein CpaF
MVLMSELDLPSRAIREQIVSAIPCVVHVRRFEDGVRRVEKIAEVTGLEGNTCQMQDIFRFIRKGRNGRNVLGEFVATGLVPRVVDDLRERDFAIDISLFQPRSGHHA